MDLRKNNFSILNRGFPCPSDYTCPGGRRQGSPASVHESQVNLTLCVSPKDFEGLSRRLQPRVPFASKNGPADRYRFPALTHPHRGAKDTGHENAILAATRSNETRASGHSAGKETILE